MAASVVGSGAMKRLTAVMLTILSLGANAFAADMPPPEGPQPMVAPVAVAPYNWNGFYIGANIGFGFATASTTVLGVTGNETLTGVIGGVQAGANYQFGPAVVGIEADFEGSGQSNSTSSFGVNVTDTIPWIGTVRGRVGFAADRFLVYGTAGAGWGSFDTNVTVAGLGNSTFSQSHIALVAGGGVEFGITNNVTARIEYLYADTGNITLANIAGINVTGRVQDNLVRVGANFKFF
jgi:outer membrane immunogenic protein